MPRTKQFESLNIHELPFKVEYLDMFQLTNIFNKHIETILNYIDEGKQPSFEVPDEDAVYRIIRLDEKQYIIDITGSSESNVIVSPIELVNLIYKKAPYIAMVGYSNS